MFSAKGLHKLKRVVEKLKTLKNTSYTHLDEINVCAHNMQLMESKQISN